MRKIPTLFVRDPEDRKYVTSEVTPGCEWVLAGEGVPTRKYDGTCVLIRRDGLAVHAFARREVKPGKEPPAGWIETEHDETTGKRVGWEPAAQSGFARWIDEAIAMADDSDITLTPGTYELVGPKVQGNPEGFAAHELIPHGQRHLDHLPSPLTFDALRMVLTHDSWPGWEGIVWHHPDGRMAKLKVRDFPRASTVDEAKGERWLVTQERAEASPRRPASLSGLDAGTIPARASVVTAGWSATTL